jgi:hypothetical protein
LHTGTTFTTPVINQTSTYYVETRYNTLASKAKRLAVKARVSKPVQSSSVSGSSTVCQASSNIVYTVDEIEGATSYIWSLPNGATGESNSNTILVDFGRSAISGTIKVRGSNVCGNGDETTMDVQVNPVPATPVITFADGVLTSDAASGNQWYFENTIVENADQNTLQPAKSGLYYTIVTQNGSVSDESNRIAAYGTKSDEFVHKRKIVLFPNPIEQGTSQIFISGIEPEEIILVELINSKGQSVYKEIQNGSGIFFDRSLETGIYLLKVQHSAGYSIEKVIVK